VLAIAAVVAVVALAGLGASAALAGKSLASILTTTIAPEPAPPTTAPAPDPAPKPPPPPPRHVSPPPPPPPAPVHVSPPPAPVVTPPPAVSPPPAPVHVSPPPPPVTHALALKPKPKPRHQRRVLPPAKPAPISRASGGPAPPAVDLVFTPAAYYSPAVATTVDSDTPGPSRAHLFFLAAVALGLLLVVAASLPGHALRPALVQEVVVVHRIDLALVGVSIVVIVGTLYLLAG
jgi:hypothetical protein